MPVRIEFRERYILAVFEGIVTTDQIATAIGRSLQDPRYERKANILLDNRPSESVASGGDIEERVRLLGSFGSRIENRIAILVSRSVHFGLGRMAQSLGEGQGLNIRVFDDEALAVDWVSEGTELENDR